MDRLTPRQAVVIIARHPGDARLSSLARDIGAGRLDDLLLAILRDVIAAVVRVDGVSVTVVAPTTVAAAHLRQVLPAGLDLIAPPQPVAGGRLRGFALAAHAHRGFERIVVIDGAVLRLTARVIGTGLGALATADTVVGGFRRGSAYAFGVRDRHIPAVLPAALPIIDGHHSASEVQDRLRGLGLGCRRLDPLPTLDAFLTMDELRRAMTALPGLGRHLSPELTADPWVAPLPIEHPRPTT